MQSSCILDPAKLLRMLYLMKLTRETELRIEQVLYRQGKIVGGVYTGRGQEAIGVGCAIELDDGDVVMPSHRDFAAYVARGIPLVTILRNWMAREDGPSRGRDKGLYFGDLERGIIPTVSALGDNCPVACGVGIALKRRKKHNVVIVCFGDGAASRGDVHEAMNFAAVMVLPVIFLINNNGFAFSTPTQKQFAVESLAPRGGAYGMPGISLNGNDVLAVYEAVQNAVRSARRGEGPSLIECKTYRMTGHAGHDSADYVPKSFLEEGRRRDPIMTFEQYLIDQAVTTPNEITELNETVLRQIDEAIAQAELSSLPEGDNSVRGVYCDDHCWWEEPIRQVDAGFRSKAKTAGS